MKRSIATALTAFLIANAAFAPSAGAQSVRQLHQACRIFDGAGVCAAWVRGVVDVMAAIGVDETLPPSVRQTYGLCSEDGITGGQAVQAFINWANDNPAEWQKSASFGVIQSLRETFPCN